MMRLILFCLCSTVVLAQLPSRVVSRGTVYNTGTVIINGDAQLSQDSIGALVRYSRNGVGDSQQVAQITYFDIEFSGRSQKNVVSAVRPLVSSHSFVTVDRNVVLELAPATWIEVKGLVQHYGDINPLRNDGTVKVNGLTEQDVSGTGRIPILEIRNERGALITQGGGLRIAERLDLQVGSLNNAPQDNISLLRNAWIWRSDSGRIVGEPETNQELNVRYYGSQRITSGAELPTQPTLLQALLQENVGGLDIARSVSVNSRLLLRGHIYTEDINPTATVVYTSGRQPEYPDLWPEVIGTLIRTNLTSTEPMVMNGAFTTMAFESSATQGNVAQIELRSKPNTVPVPTTDIAFKVDRFMQLRVRDSGGTIVADSTYTLLFGYAWRTASVPNLETGDIVETIPELVGREDSLVLLRFDGSSYDEYGQSILPTQRSGDANSLWRYSTARSVRAGGDFAIGLNTGPVWILNARLFLEGPMRDYADDITPVMATELAVQGLIPSTAPDIFPYNRDPARPLINVPIVPDTVVDWVTMELRPNAQDDGPAALTQVLFLTQSGEVIDPLTHRPKVITNIKPGQYHVAFRHRNHLSIITETPVRVDRGNIGYTVDFTNGSGVLGGAASQKLLGTFNGRRIFGLAVGDGDVEGTIARTDYNLLWDNRDAEGYVIFDTNLDGVVTTRDMNLSWNNRGRSSVAPK
jgi:hypothetical protein